MDRGANWIHLGLPSLIWSQVWMGSVRTRLSLLGERPRLAPARLPKALSSLDRWIGPTHGRAGIGPIWLKLLVFYIYIFVFFKILVSHLSVNHFIRNYYLKIIKN